MNYARELPWITPSTFTIGTILKIKLFSNVVDSYEGVIKKSMIPYSMNPDVVSPGCCLAMIQTDFFALLTTSELVISRRST